MLESTKESLRIEVLNKRFKELYLELLNRNQSDLAIEICKLYYEVQHLNYSEGIAFMNYLNKK